MTPLVEFNEGPPRKYTVDGIEVPSVTQILNCLNQGQGLLWWAMKVGCEGAMKLRDRGMLPADVEDAVRRLTSEQLTINHVRDTAATRGTSLHTALEQWAQARKVPNAIDFPAEDRGFVQALARALVTLQPDIQRTEVVVGSADHGYAGRYDMFAKIGNRWGRLDLKTGKRVYDQAHLQLAAYELAAIECGEDPSDFRAVLRLDAEGGWEFVESQAEPWQFLSVLSAFEALQALKEQKRRAKAQEKLAA